MLSSLRVALLTAALCLGCSDPSGPGPGVDPITELPRPLTANEQAVIAASNLFGFDLASRVVANDPRANVVLSPLSASMALGMALNGADGTTFTAMRDALGFGGLTQQEVNASYRDLIDLLTDLDPTVQFEIANAIWANQGVPFHQAFFDAVAAAFDARAESRDFADPATLDAINAWVEDHTGGLIDSILDSLDPALVMLLVNAIYFDGAWTAQFDPADTRRQFFMRGNGSTVDVDMMTMEDPEVRGGYGATYSAVELPYGGDAFSMVIVLPHQGTSARDWLATLDANGWTSLVGGLGPSNVEYLALPKFTLTFDSYLNEPLQAMGMDPAFHPGADFTNMSPIGDQLCIGFVRQKTYIEVDERGTRAAAVTAVGVSVTSAGGSFVVDRPFAFAIRERLSGTVLFVGLVEDPTAQDTGPEPFTTDCG
ncbi:MAG: serpin family protein [Longimicrobiales bacterium]